VVGVAEDDLRADVFEDGLGDGLDGSLGAYGHEDGCLYGLMGQMEACTAGAGGVCREEFKT